MTWSAGARGLVLALLVLLIAPAAVAQPKFPPLTGRVVDNAQLLSPQAEQRLTGQLATLEAQTGRQFVVATVPDLQGYEIEEFGYQLGRTWGIGRKGEDDGVILLVAPKERRVRIEVGYGLEPVLTDALANVIITSRILPHFKEGRFEQGILDGADAIVDQLALPEDEARARVAQAEQRPAEAEGGSAVPVLFVIFIVFWVLGGILRGFGGRRRRYGGGAWWLIPLILSSGGGRHRGGGWGGGGGFGGGFGGGGGSFGGGGSSGSW